MKNVETLKTELKNILQQWDDNFIASPYEGFGYNNFTNLYEQAHDDIVGEFMRDNFNTYDELGREDKDWSEIEEANDFYELEACDLRFDADLRMQDWVSENGNNLNEFIRENKEINDKIKELDVSVK